MPIPREWLLNHIELGAFLELNRGLAYSGAELLDLGFTLHDDFRLGSSEEDFEHDGVKYRAGTVFYGIK